MKYCYSTNEEEFYGEYDTPEEAAEEAFYSDDELTEVFVGEICHASTFIEGKCDIFADDIVERIDEYLYDYIGAEDEILSMSQEKNKEFGELIFNFIKENADFHRWGVKNTKTIYKS